MAAARGGVGPLCAGSGRPAATVWRAGDGASPSRAPRRHRQHQPARTSRIVFEPRRSCATTVHPVRTGPSRGTVVQSLFGIHRHLCTVADKGCMCVQRLPDRLQ